MERESFSTKEKSPLPGRNLKRFRRDNTYDSRYEAVTKERPHDCNANFVVECRVINSSLVKLSQRLANSYNDAHLSSAHVCSPRATMMTRCLMQPLSTEFFLNRHCVYISLNSLAVTSPRYSSSSSYSSPPALSMPTYSKASTTRSTGKPISTNLSTMSRL
jgi:hypothetical protein